MFKLEGRCYPCWGLWYYVPQKCSAMVAKARREKMRGDLVWQTEYSFQRVQPHIILKALGNRGQRVLKIKGEGDKALQGIYRPTGQAGRARLPGKLAGWTAYLRLKNRDISQAWAWGKKPENQVFKLSSLNGSYGYNDLRIKFLVELAAAIFKCYIQSVMLYLKFFLLQIRFTSRKQNSDGHVSSPNVQHPPSGPSY